MNEPEFLALLRPLATDAGARGFVDDAALLGDLVLTSDTIAEGIHFLPTDPAQDVAWKLLAVNLSDLASKGARPVGALLNYTLAGDAAWDRAFVEGFQAALEQLGCPLLGGDTVALPPGTPRVLSLTAVGRATGPVPSRIGARAGDSLYVTGTIGDAGLGLAIAREEPGPPELLAAYRRPAPRQAEGAALAQLVTAMMDVSDGLLIDAARMAAASSLALRIDIAAIPLSPAFLAHRGGGREERLFAATAGDDYQLLFAAPPELVLPVAAVRVGSFAAGSGLALHDGAGPIPLPDWLGYQHSA